MKGSVLMISWNQFSDKLNQFLLQVMLLNLLLDQCIILSGDVMKCWKPL